MLVIYSFIFYAAMFKEYRHVYTQQDGTLEGIYFYECCEYPGHYIRWYCNGPTVDCEVTICNLYGEIMLITVAMSFLAENQHPTYQLLPVAEESSK